MALKVGDKVKIDIDSYECFGTAQHVRRFNGFRSRVSRIQTVKNQRYYELEGIVSDSGIPFSLVAEWLMLIDESEDKK